MSTSSDASRAELGRLRQLLPWTTLAWVLVAAANVVAALIPLRWHLLLTSEGGLDAVPFSRLLFPEADLRAGVLGIEGAITLAREQPVRAALFLSLFYLLVAWPLLVAFLFRASRALAAGPPPLPRFAAHWTITGFLLPFANLVLPLLVVRDLWRCAAARADGAPTPASSSPLPRLWWEVWIAGVVLNGAWAVLVWLDPLKWAAIGIAGSLVNALAAALTVLLVRALLELQAARVEGRTPATPVDVLPASVAVDGAVLCLLGLLLVVGHLQVSRRASDALGRILAGRPAPDARALAETPLAIDDGASGVEGPVGGGTGSGVLGGVPGGGVAPFPPEPPTAAAADADEPLRVGGDVAPPVRIGGDPPKYTEMARRARIQGIVVLETVIDRSGNVTSVRVLKGLPMGLDQAAVDAVRTWKFRPGNRNGEPVPVYFILTVSFRVTD